MFVLFIPESLGERARDVAQLLSMGEALISVPSTTYTCMVVACL